MAISANTQSASSSPALELKQLKKTYGSGFEALKGISLSVQRGDFFALLGPNGAGKSTTIGILCSLIQKTSGAVKIFDIDIDRDFPRAKQLIGVVPQEYNLNPYERCEDILVNQAGYFGVKTSQARERALFLLKALQLEKQACLPSRQLSGGMKRRLMIARAMVHEPALLILDEPTAGVDVESRRSMWELFEGINEQGTTIILTTHYLEEVERLCNKVAIIDHGQIVKNTGVKELIAELDYETFILDVRYQKTVALPQLANCTLSSGIDNAIELVIKRGELLNRVFEGLSEAGIDVLSLRNKTNRLEELFVNLVADSRAPHKRTERHQG